MMKGTDYQVVKAFNNNVVLALQQGKERILIAKGIGFGKKAADIIPAHISVDKVFSIENTENSGHLHKLLDQISDEIFIICEKIIHMISTELNEELDEKIHINLVDHIAFMLKRLLSDDEIINPFLTEIEILYKQEFELAKKAVAMLQEYSKTPIPSGEIGFIAMHIHSARHNGNLSQTIKCALVSNKIVELIETEQKIKIHRTSFDYARFITHVRFTVERLINSTPITNALLTTIKRKYKSSYALAKKAGNILASELAISSVSEGELGNLALHIERLCTRD